MIRESVRRPRMMMSLTYMHRIRGPATEFSANLWNCHRFWVKGPCSFHRILWDRLPVAYYEARSTCWISVSYPASPSDAVILFWSYYWWNITVCCKTEQIWSELGACKADFPQCNAGIHFRESDNDQRVFNASIASIYIYIISGFVTSNNTLLSFVPVSYAP